MVRGAFVMSVRNAFLIADEDRKREIEAILCQMRVLRNKLRRLLSFPVYVDYEKWVRERSEELFGEVKEFYTYTETAKLLGVATSTIAYRVWRGQIKTFAGRIPFSEIVVLAEYYRDLKEFNDVLNRKGDKCNS
jgi:hypothetical protein